MKQEEKAKAYDEAIKLAREGGITMTNKRIDIFKVEEFLIDNLKELPMGNGNYKIKAECSLTEFLEKFEKAMEM